MTREEAIAEIREKTPELLKEYRALAEALKPLLGITDDADDPDKEEIASDELEELYEAIREFAEAYDLDSIDRMLKDVKRDYRIPEGEKERFAKVEQCIRESDWDALKEVW